MQQSGVYSILQSGLRSGSQPWRLPTWAVVTAGLLLAALIVNTGGLIVKLMRPQVRVLSSTPGRAARSTAAPSPPAPTVISLPLPARGSVLAITTPVILHRQLADGRAPAVHRNRQANRKARAKVDDLLGL